MAITDIFYKQKGKKKPQALQVKQFTAAPGPTERELVRGDAERYREHVKKQRQALGLE